MNLLGISENVMDLIDALNDIWASEDIFVDNILVDGLYSLSPLFVFFAMLVAQSVCVYLFFIALFCSAMHKLTKTNSGKRKCDKRKILDENIYFRCSLKF